MDLHGSDICVKSEKIPINPSLVEILIEDHWPDRVCEVDSDTNSLFFFKDQVAREAWDKEGWSEENDMTMIHMMWSPAKPFEMWFVIDDKKKNKYIIDDIEQFIRNCDNGQV